MKSEYNAPPNRERLLQRIQQIGGELPDNPTPDEIAHEINQLLADQAVCSRALIDGKQKCLRFSEYWSHVFNQKWKYVPHEERGLLKEWPK
jgi:hypothetical protein